MKILLRAKILLLLFVGLTRQASSATPAKAELFKPREGFNNFFAKMNSGETVKIAYFGGSITQCPFGWRVKTFKWFKETYPKAKFEEIYAAKGGAGSNDGAERMAATVIAKKPDLIFVEFAVNDFERPPAQVMHTMESIVRQAWTADPNVDICFIYTLRANFAENYSRGIMPPITAVQDKVADYYGIPSIDVAYKMVQSVNEGKVYFQGKTAPSGAILFSTDVCHPTEPAHGIYAALIEDSIKQLASKGKPGQHVLNNALTPDEHKKP